MCSHPTGDHASGPASPAMRGDAMRCDVRHCDDRALRGAPSGGSTPRRRRSPRRSCRGGTAGSEGILRVLLHYICSVQLHNSCVYIIYPILITVSLKDCASWKKVFASIP
jgi:hypothetical protein